MTVNIENFRHHLEKGSIQKAYRAVVSYMMGLRTHFEKNYPDLRVSGFYQGYMDMTYFALFPASLKERKLKIAVVFNYETFGFEVWLSGSNRRVARQNWELLKDHEWPGLSGCVAGRALGRLDS